MLKEKTTPQSASNKLEYRTHSEVGGYLFYADGTAKRVHDGKVVNPSGKTHRVRLNDKSYRLDKLILEAFHGPSPDEYRVHVGYKDGVRKNLEPSNLYWTFIGYTGGRKPKNLISEHQFKRIYELYFEGYTVRELAEKLGISFNSATGVLIGKSFPDAPRPVAILAWPDEPRSAAFRRFSDGFVDTDYTHNVHKSIQKPAKVEVPESRELPQDNAQDWRYKCTNGIRVFRLTLLVDSPTLYANTDLLKSDFYPRILEALEASKESGIRVLGGKLVSEVDLDGESAIELRVQVDIDKLLGSEKGTNLEEKMMAAIFRANFPLTEDELPAGHDLSEFNSSGISYVSAELYTK